MRRECPTHRLATRSDNPTDSRNRHVARGLCLVVACGLRDLVPLLGDRRRRLVEL